MTGVSEHELAALQARVDVLLTRLTFSSRHVRALERSDGPAAIRREAPIGRAAIGEMERLLGDAATGARPMHPHPTLDSAGAWHPLSSAAPTLRGEAARAAGAVDQAIR
jgi:hypothetical protein